MGPDVSDFIDSLVRDLQQGRYRDVLRLVLMGRERLRLPEGRFIRRETLRKEDVHLEDIRHYFRDRLSDKESSEASELVWQRWRRSWEDEGSLELLNRTVADVSERYT